MDGLAGMEREMCQYSNPRDGAHGFHSSGLIVWLIHTQACLASVTLHVKHYCSVHPASSVARRPLVAPFLSVASPIIVTRRPSHFRPSCRPSSLSLVVRRLSPHFRPSRRTSSSPSSLAHFTHQRCPSFIDRRTCLVSHGISLSMVRCWSLLWQEPARTIICP